MHAKESYRVGDASRGDALGCGRITEHDLDVQAAREVAAATGLSAYWAEQDVVLARALCTRLPGTLAALGTGRIDVVRARTMAEHTADLVADALAARFPDFTEENPEDKNPDHRRHRDHHGPGNRRSRQRRRADH